MPGIVEVIDGRNPVDELLDETAVKAALLVEPGATSVKIGNFGEGWELVVENCRFAERYRVGERLLTGRGITQPVVALVENNGRRAVTPLPYAEDVLGLPTTFPLQVISCLRGFNAEKA